MRDGSRTSCLIRAHLQEPNEAATHLYSLQEMEELKTLLKMGDERMTFLKELQGAPSIMTEHGRV